MIGRKYLVKVPTNTPHLLERFGLFTIILLGESIVSLLAVMHPEEGDWSSIGFSPVSFAIIISMWWQYFDSMEKKVDKRKETAGQIIIYGHLFIYLLLGLIAAPIRLTFLEDVSYVFS
ncbi:hypothetical protein AAV35_010815 [Salimicrobium jeotgali]|uniref:Low temperature requirement protein A n=2 Tax=Salimicrobium TaxID=351195 RepID=K2H9Q0_9BACI|nr:MULTISPECIES: low temperature requirement protein A [Salimicrobium]APC65598.1 hypothetical protein AAV35_010815 [Salimicrobium jeotgali]EKE32390.1 low temperature requirement protein A [Salimicrobium jeotgali]MBM7695631.1 low temperature requirement protein LtrA [Salimicrobium jeotgali]SIS75719.1 low temperature requirement A protein (LtrA) [Salimicrobium salexigens]